MAAVARERGAARAAILEAAGRILLHDGSGAFSVRAVAADVLVVMDATEIARGAARTGRKCRWTDLHASRDPCNWRGPREGGRKGGYP